MLVCPPPTILIGLSTVRVFVSRYRRPFQVVFWIIAWNRVIVANWFTSSSVGRDKTRRVVFLRCFTLLLRANYKDYATVKGLNWYLRFIYVFFLVSVSICMDFFYGIRYVFCFGSVTANCDWSYCRLMRVNQAIQ